MPTALITGANRGIGLELCRTLCDAQFRVIAACRTSSTELAKLDLRVIESIDVSSGKSVEDLARALEGESLDLVINNAGILTVETLDQLDVARIQKQFEVNALGPLRVTHALLPNLKRGSKIALITSRMGSIGDNGSGGYYGYRMSKAALNMAGVSLARDLKSKGISVGIFHPGYVATDMTGHHGNTSARESAAQLVERIAQLTLENTGTFWHADGQVLPW